MQTLCTSIYRKTLILIATLMLGAGSAHTEATNWEIDPEHFSIGFEIGHIGFKQQLGLFLSGAGHFRYDPETLELSEGRVEVQANSVFTNHDRRDNHVRNADFLDVTNHPDIVFVATTYMPRDENGGTLTGDLTLLGNTHPVDLDITINKLDTYPFGHRRETLGISAHATILRSRWGMDYGVANNMVGDEVILRFEFEALRQ